MAEYLVTMQEYNETAGNYDILYPVTVKENIEDLDELGGARIVVTVIGGEAGQIIYLKLGETETMEAETDSSGVAIFDNLQYGDYQVVANVLGAFKREYVVIDTLKIYEVSFSVANPILDDNSWEAISAISASGEAANYWNVGDTKTITINGTVGNTTFSNLSIDAYILGINHNANLEGNNRIHFCIGKIGGKAVGLIDSQYNNYPVTTSGYFAMNYSSNTNAGGWNGCYMRSTIMPAIKNALPSDLQSVLKTVTKYTDNVGNGSGSVSSNVTATTETICLEAEFEVQGKIAYANGYEQDKQLQYDYYKNGNSKIRYKYNDVNTAAYWWNRSPKSGGSSTFCYVGDSGGEGTGNSRRCYAIAPIFFV